MEAVAPAGEGTVDVTVRNPLGASATGAADRYSYISPAVVGAVSPATGPDVGGTTVTISGQGFTGTTAVCFGPVPAKAFVVQSDYTIVATSPPGRGTVDVTVLNMNGWSWRWSRDLFTYISPPLITSLNPPEGPESGGRIVYIGGSGFAEATAVSFGAVPVTSIARGTTLS